MNHTTGKMRKRLPQAVSSALLLLALGAATSGAAEAARFGVRVVDSAGEPIAGASVCVGLHGNYRQFGTTFTDLDGNARLVEVPNVPFVVTISKTRFAAVRMEQPSVGYDLVREVELSGGLPGPRCKAGSSMAANPPSIDVRNVDIAGERSRPTLTPEVTGEPNHYRLALNEDFVDATWREFDQTITVPGELSGNGSIFLQLRRFEGRRGSWLEARSDIVEIVLPN